MAGREIGAAFFYGANTAYDYPEAAKFTEALKNVRMKVSFAERVDETAAHCNIQVPDHNSFEGWNDYQPGPGVYYVTQPTIHPLFNTRQMKKRLLHWRIGSAKCRERGGKNK